MSAAKVSIVALALCAGLVAVQAAAGVKGGLQQPLAAASVKGPSFFARPRQPQPQPQVFLPVPVQQEYLPPPPPPRPLLPPPAPAAIKGPVFSAARIAPIAPPPPPPPAPIVQQQQQIIVEQEPVQQQVQQQAEQEPEPAIVQQQIVQQQQEPQPSQQKQEVDPNADAQDNVPAIVAPSRATPSAVSEEEANPKPEPYAFQYGFESGDSATSGSSQREEQQDASGRVTGFYTLKGEDGRDRRVDYIADASGFRATISTNEMGTAPKDSADVDWNAQAPSDAQLRTADSATQAARQRALLNPQPDASASSSSSSSLSASTSFGQKSLASPRQNVAAASQARQQLAAAPSKTNFQQAQQQQQLQEQFEQIRQIEVNGRARKSRHAPFYLYTV